MTGKEILELLYNNGYRKGGFFGQFGNTEGLYFGVDMGSGVDCTVVSKYDKETDTFEIIEVYNKKQSL